MNLTRTRLGAVLLPLALALGACSQGNDPRAANETNFSRAMTQYLARRGDLCLGRSTWPVDVTREEFAHGSRNSLQLPVLEKLGLVASTVVDLEGSAGYVQTVHRTQARRYQLTDQGRLYDLARAPRKREAASKVADHDLCVARLKLHRVVGWDRPNPAADGAQTVVSYTYDIEAAPWFGNAEARRVFPVIDRMVQGAGRLQLKEGMVLTAQGWEARDL